MVPERMYCKYLIPGRKSPRRSMPLPKQHMPSQSTFQMCPPVLHTTIWTQNSVSITETSLLVGLGVQSKLRETKFGTSETFQLGMQQLQAGSSVVQDILLL